ncbi:hypothetical protein LTR95_006970 [Oleoguttula sp. CCFEE 5521]
MEIRFPQSNTDTSLFRFLDLPKELRQDILEMVVCASKPSVKAVPSSDELITKRGFERRCAQFVEMPVLHTCKVVREEVAPMIEKAPNEFAAELKAEAELWAEISRKGKCQLPSWNSTKLAWKDAYDHGSETAIERAARGKTCRVVRKYRTDGDLLDGDRFEQVPDEVVPGNEAQ